jgi:ligand-binding sensor protein
VVYNLEKKDIENTNIQNQEVLSKVDEEILEKIKNLNILSE